jgi:transposase-like protein
MLLKSSNVPLCSDWPTAAYRCFIEAEELGVSFWSLRRWRREYAKATAAGESTGGTPAPAAPAQETKSMNAAMIDNDKALAETISHIESEIAHVDQELAVLNQNREALNRVLVMFKERAGSRAKRHD